MSTTVASDNLYTFGIWVNKAKSKKNKATKINLALICTLIWACFLIPYTSTGWKNWGIAVTIEMWDSIRTVQQHDVGLLFQKRMFLNSRPSWSASMNRWWWSASSFRLPVHQQIPWGESAHFAVYLWCYWSKQVKWKRRWRLSIWISGWTKLLKHVTYSDWFNQVGYRKSGANGTDVCFIIIPKNYNMYDVRCYQILIEIYDTEAKMLRWEYSSFNHLLYLHYAPAE